MILDLPESDDVAIRGEARLRGTVRVLCRLSRVQPPDPIHGFVRSQTAAVAVRRVGRRDHLRPYRAPPPQGAPAPGTAGGRGRAADVPRPEVGVKANGVDMEPTDSLGDATIL